MPDPKLTPELRALLMKRIGPKEQAIVDDVKKAWDTVRQDKKEEEA
jgi:hypothetical protein